MQWYYSKNGTQLGPISEGELRAKLASGEVSPAELVWREGMSDWLPSSRVPELASIAALPSAVSPIPHSLENSANSPSSPYNPPAAAPAPPAYQSYLPRGQDIPNYLWQSIVVTIFCCWPFGIPAIVYAAKVEGLKARGDIAGAMAASSSAKTWCMVAAGIGIAFVLLWGVLVGFSAVFSSHR